MIPSANARHYRIKAAQRDLIAAAGGIARVADLVGFSKSHVGRWNNGESPDLMPLDAVWTLEGETGMPLVTAAMAEINGRRLDDGALDTAAAAESVMQAHAEVMEEVGDLMKGYAQDIADGKLTPSEAVHLDQLAAALERGVSHLRAALAGVRGAGGFSVVGGGAK